MSDASRVRDLMTPDPEALDRDERLSIANDLMQLARIRHLPVIDANGDVIGIVSQRDLFRCALERALASRAESGTAVLESIPVAEVMSQNVATIDADASLAEAARLMRARAIGCLPVLEGGEFVGILTESDFVAWAAAPPGRTKG
jgi:CBS domain-containing membrane protein